MEIRGQGKAAPAFGRVCRVAFAVLAWSWGADPATAQDARGNARLQFPRHRTAVIQAIMGAARRLEHTECQGLLDEFADRSGRSLRSVLSEQALEPREFLDRVFFYDASQANCERDTTLAGMTFAGSRVIQICGQRFARTVAENQPYAEAVIIHEMLHALGLGENPPSSYHITSRVQARCRRNDAVRDERLSSY